MSLSSFVQHALDGCTVGNGLGAGVGEVDIEGHRMVFVSSLDIHLVQFAAGGCDLLNPELAKLGLELAELLDQVILALVPELTGLDL